MPQDFGDLIGEGLDGAIVNSTPLKTPLEFPVVAYNGIWYLPNIQIERLAEINKMRKAIGLSSIQDIIEKLQFYNKHMLDGVYNSKYSVTVGVSAVFDTDDEDQDKNWQKTEKFPKE